MLICRNAKSCCLRLVNQLSVKPQNDGDLGLDFLSWQTLPASAPWLFFFFLPLAGDLAFQNDQSVTVYFWPISKTVEVPEARYPGVEQP